MQNLNSWHCPQPLPTEDLWLSLSLEIQSSQKFGFSLCICFPVRSDGIAFRLVIQQLLYMISLPGRQHWGKGKFIQLEKGMYPAQSQGKWSGVGMFSAWLAAVHGSVKSRTWLNDFPFTFHFHALEKEMATHFSVLSWRIPGMGESGGLPSMGSHRVGQVWSDLAAAAAEKTTMAVSLKIYCAQSS